MQIYNVLEWILEQTGKAHITIISFSISEEFIRKVYRLRNKDLIQDVKLVIDLKSAQKLKEIMGFAYNVFDEVFLSKNHSKVILIETENLKVVVVGSQNATRGDREESGLITTNVHVFEKYHSNIQRIINESIKYELHQ